MARLSWTMLAAAMLLGFGATAAPAQQAIAVTQFTTNLTEAQAQAGGMSLSGITDGFSDMLVTDLVSLLDDPAFEKCGAHVVEWTRAGDVEKELDFQDSKYVDQTSVEDGIRRTVNRLVRGNVSADGDGVTWLIDVEAPSGRVADVEGRGSLTDLFDSTNEIARQLLDTLCKPKPVRISAGLNDLDLGGDVCDLTQPFTLQGRGQTSDLRFNFVPATAENGTFTLSGTAAGVSWSGGGTYEIQDVNGEGAIFLEGAWQLTSPMGVFGTNDIIAGTVSPLHEGCPTAG